MPDEATGEKVRTPSSPHRRVGSSSAGPRVAPPSRSWSHPREGPVAGPSSHLTRRTRPAQLRCPHPLPTPARPAQPSEPILFPKLRIWLADFPYLHCSIDQRLFTLETCCGYGYGLAQKSYRSHGFSRDGGSAPDTARAAVLYRNNVHISGQADSMESVLYKEKKTLPGTPADSLRVRLRYRHGSHPPGPQRSG